MNIFGSSKNPNKALLLNLVNRLVPLRHAALMESWLPSRSLLTIKTAFAEAVGGKELSDYDLLKFCKYYFSLPDTSKHGINLSKLLAKSPEDIPPPIRNEFNSKLVDPFDFLIIHYIGELFKITPYLPRREDPATAAIDSAKAAFEKAKEDRWKTETTSEQNLLKEMLVGYYNELEAYEKRQIELSKSKEALDKESIRLTMQSYRGQLDAILLVQADALTKRNAYLKDQADKLELNRQSLEAEHSRIAADASAMTFADRLRADLDLAQKTIQELETQIKLNDSELKLVFTAKLQSLEEDLINFKHQQANIHTEINEHIREVAVGLEHEAIKRDEKADACFKDLYGQLNTLKGHLSVVESERAHQYELLFKDFTDFEERIQHTLAGYATVADLANLTNFSLHIAEDQKKMQEKFIALQQATKTAIAGLESRISALEGLPETIKPLLALPSQVKALIAKMSELDEVKSTVSSIADKQVLLEAQFNELKKSFKQFQSIQIKPSIDLVEIYRTIDASRTGASVTLGEDLGKLQVKVSDLEDKLKHFQGQHIESMLRFELEYSAIEERLSHGFATDLNESIKTLKNQLEYKQKQLELHLLDKQMQMQLEFRNLQSAMTSLSVLPDGLKKAMDRLSTVEFKLEQRLVVIENKVRRLERQMSDVRKVLFGDSSGFSSIQFEAAMREHYLKIAMVEEPFSNRKIPVDKCYINLAIIEGKDQTNKETQLLKARSTSQKTDIDRSAMLSSFETIFAVKHSIEMNDLFAQFFEGDKNQRMNIVGRAGIGKTTLCKRIAAEWAKKSSKRVLFWVPLRLLNADRYPAGRSYEVVDIILKEIYGRLDAPLGIREQLRQYINSPQSVWLLDGYDEAFGRIPGHLKGVLDELLNQPCRILTSRPYYLGDVKADTELEVTGFTDDNIYKYVHAQMQHVTSSIKPDELANKLLNYLEANPSIWGIAHVPVNLALICSVFQSQAKLIEKDLTISHLYLELRLWLFKRYILRDSHSRIDPARLTERRIEKDTEALQELLSNIALHNTTHDTLLIPGAKLQALLREFEIKHPDEDALMMLLECGLLKSLGGEDENEEEKSYYFIHLTFQELYTALWLSKKILNEGDSPEVRSFIAENKYKLRYELIWSFTSGILAQQESAKGLNQFIHLLFIEEPHDLYGQFDVSLLIRCLEECHNRIDELEDKNLLLNWASKFITAIFKQKPKLAMAIFEILGQSLHAVHRLDIAEPFIDLLKQEDEESQNLALKFIVRLQLNSEPVQKLLHAQILDGRKEAIFAAMALKDISDDIKLALLYTKWSLEQWQRLHEDSLFIANNALNDDVAIYESKGDWEKAEERKDRLHRLDLDYSDEFYRLRHRQLEISSGDKYMQKGYKRWDSFKDYLQKDYLQKAERRALSLEDFKNFHIKSSSIKISNKALQKRLHEMSKRINKQKVFVYDLLHESETQLAAFKLVSATHINWSKVKTNYYPSEFLLEVRPSSILLGEVDLNSHHTKATITRVDAGAVEEMLEDDTTSYHITSELSRLYTRIKGSIKVTDHSGASAGAGSVASDSVIGAVAEYSANKLMRKKWYAEYGDYESAKVGAISKEIEDINKIDDTDSVDDTPSDRLSEEEREKLDRDILVILNNPAHDATFKANSLLKHKKMNYHNVPCSRLIETLIPYLKASEQVIRKTAFAFLADAIKHEEHIHVLDYRNSLMEYLGNLNPEIEQDGVKALFEACKTAKHDEAFKAILYKFTVKAAPTDKSRGSHPSSPIRYQLHAYDNPMQTGRLAYELICEWVREETPSSGDRTILNELYRKNILNRFISAQEVLWIKNLSESVSPHDQQIIHQVMWSGDIKLQFEAIEFLISQSEHCPERLEWLKETVDCIDDEHIKNLLKIYYNAPEKASILSQWQNAKATINFSTYFWNLCKIMAKNRQTLMDLVLALQSHIRVVQDSSTNQFISKRLKSSVLFDMFYDLAPFNESELPLTQTLLARSDNARLALQKHFTKNRNFELFKNLIFDNPFLDQTTSLNALKLFVNSINRDALLEEESTDKPTLDTYLSSEHIQQLILWFLNSRSPASNDIYDLLLDTLPSNEIPRLIYGYDHEALIKKIKDFDGLKYSYASRPVFDQMKKILSSILHATDDSIRLPLCKRIIDYCLSSSQSRIVRTRGDETGLWCSFKLFINAHPDYRDNYDIGLAHESEEISLIYAEKFKEKIEDLSAFEKTEQLIEKYLTIQSHAAKKLFLQTIQTIMNSNKDELEPYWINKMMPAAETNLQLLAIQVLSSDQKPRFTYPPAIKRLWDNIEMTIDDRIAIINTINVLQQHDPRLINILHKALEMNQNEINSAVYETIFEWRKLDSPILNEAEENGLLSELLIYFINTEQSYKPEHSTNKVLYAQKFRFEKIFSAFWQKEEWDEALLEKLTSLKRSFNPNAILESEEYLITHNKTLGLLILANQSPAQHLNKWIKLINKCLDEKHELSKTVFQYVKDRNFMVETWVFDILVRYNYNNEQVIEALLKILDTADIKQVNFAVKNLINYVSDNRVVNRLNYLFDHNSNQHLALNLGLSLLAAPSTIDKTINSILTLLLNMPLSLLIKEERHFSESLNHLGQREYLSPETLTLLERVAELGWDAKPGSEPSKWYEIVAENVLIPHAYYIEWQLFDWLYTDQLDKLVDAYQQTIQRYRSLRACFFNHELLMAAIGRYPIYFVGTEINLVINRQLFKQNLDPELALSLVHHFTDKQPAGYYPLLPAKLGELSSLALKSVRNKTFMSEQQNSNMLLHHAIELQATEWVIDLIKAEAKLDSTLAEVKETAAEKLAKWPMTYLQPVLMYLLTNQAEAIKSNPVLLKTAVDSLDAELIEAGLKLVADADKLSLLPISINLREIKSEHIASSNFTLGDDPLRLSKKLLNSEDKVAHFLELVSLQEAQPSMRINLFHNRNPLHIGIMAYAYATQTKKAAILAGIVKLLDLQKAYLDMADVNGQLPLYYAINTLRSSHSNGLQLIKALLNAGADPDKTHYKGQSVLQKLLQQSQSSSTYSTLAHLLIQKSRFFMRSPAADILIKYGEDEKIAGFGKFTRSIYAFLTLDPNKTGLFGKSILHFITEQFLQKLYQDGSSIILHPAIEPTYQLIQSVHTYSGNPRADWRAEMQFAIEQLGADPNAQDDHGETVLHYIAKTGAKEDFQFLLNFGTDLSIKNRNKYTAFDIAIIFKNAKVAIEIARMLQTNRSHKKMLDAYKSKVAYCLDPITQGLWNNDISPLLSEKRETYVDLMGRNALLLAIDYVPEQAELFLSAESTAQQNYLGQTALMIAARNNHFALVKAMLEKGAKPLVCDREGRQALHYAASAEIADALLHAGAELEAKDKLGRNAFFYAQSAELVEYLFKKGLDPHLTDSHGKSIFAYPRYAHIKDHLLILGAKPAIEVTTPVKEEDHLADLAKDLALLFGAEIDLTKLKSSLIEKLLEAYRANFIDIPTHVYLAKLLLQDAHRQLDCIKLIKAGQELGIIPWIEGTHPVFSHSLFKGIHTTRQSYHGRVNLERLILRYDETLMEVLLGIARHPKIPESVISSFISTHFFDRRLSQPNPLIIKALFSGPQIKAFMLKHESKYLMKLLDIFLSNYDELHEIQPMLVAIIKEASLDSLKTLSSEIVDKHSALLKLMQKFIYETTYDDLVSELLNRIGETIRDPVVLTSLLQPICMLKSDKAEGVQRMRHLWLLHSLLAVGAEAKPFNPEVAKRYAQLHREHPEHFATQSLIKSMTDSLRLWLGSDITLGRITPEELVSLLEMFYIDKEVSHPLVLINYLMQNNQNILLKLAGHLNVIHPITHESVLQMLISSWKATVIPGNRPGRQQPFIFQYDSIHSYNTALINAFEAILSYKPNLEHRCRNGATALHLAVIRKAWPLVDLMIKAGANVLTSDQYGTNIIRRLYDTKVSPFTEPEVKATVHALYEMAISSAGKEHAVVSNIWDEIDIIERKTPLQHVIEEWRKPAYEGKTLRKAFTFANKDIAENNAKILAKTSEYLDKYPELINCFRPGSDTPLMLAIRNIALPIVEILLARGADVRLPSQRKIFNSDRVRLVEMTALELIDNMLADDTQHHKETLLSIRACIIEASKDESRRLVKVLPMPEITRPPVDESIAEYIEKAKKHKKLLNGMISTYDYVVCSLVYPEIARLQTCFASKAIDLSIKPSVKSCTTMPEELNPHKRKPARLFSITSVINPEIDRVQQLFEAAASGPLETLYRDIDAMKKL